MNTTDTDATVDRIAKSVIADWVRIDNVDGITLTIPQCKKRVPGGEAGAFRKEDF